MRYWEHDREESVEKSGMFRDFRVGARGTRHTVRPSAVTSGGSVSPFLRHFYRHRAVVSAPVQRFFLFLVLAGVIYAFILGDGGAIRIAMLQRESGHLDRRISELQRNADMLQTEIARLESDPFYIEKTGRERYGYIRPGERVYKLVPTNEKSN